MPVFGLLSFVTRKYLHDDPSKGLNNGPESCASQKQSKCPKKEAGQYVRRVTLLNVPWIELDNVEGHQHQANRQQSPG